MSRTENFEKNGIVHIENLVKRYGSLVALDHVRFLDFWDRMDPVRQQQSTACWRF